MRTQLYFVSTRWFQLKRGSSPLAKKLSIHACFSTKPMFVSIHFVKVDETNSVSFLNQTFIFGF